MPEILTVHWSRVHPFAGQPRRYFDEEEIDSLAASIKQIGQVSPVLAFPARKPGHFELIDGERRWRAVQRAGLATIRVEVTDEPDPDKRFALAVAANFGRQGHAPLEIADAIHRMLKTQTREQVAAVFGKSPGWVTQHLMLKNLHPDVAELLEPGRARAASITFSDAIRLSVYPHPVQVDAAAKILEEMKDGISSQRAASLVLGAIDDSERRNPQYLGKKHVAGRTTRSLGEKVEAQLRRWNHDLREVAPELYGQIARSRIVAARKIPDLLRRLRDAADERLKAIEGEAGR